MKLAFLEPMPWGYDTVTPLYRPLGGSQSALCYLAAELVRQGHEVSILNEVSEPGLDANGVHILPRAQATSDSALMKRFDVIVVSNLAIGEMLRNALGFRVPLVLWTGHAPDQGAVESLSRLEEREAWHGYAFVSNWQASAYQRAFSIPSDKIQVLHNGIAPAFASAPLCEPWFVQGRDPVLAYTSTPFRGLTWLLDAFPAIREAFPNARLRVFSSMAVYNLPASQDDYSRIYERCDRMDQVEYVGSVSQSQLPIEMAQCAGLAYPSVFPETFCISAAEALAIGASLLTTRCGALPSLFGEYGEFIDLSSDLNGFESRYGDLVIESLRKDLAAPELRQKRRQANADAVRQRFSWPSLARSWIEWLHGLLEN